MDKYTYSDHLQLIIDFKKLKEKVERLEEYIGELEQNKPKLETINSIRKKHGLEALEEKS